MCLEIDAPTGVAIDNKHVVGQQVEQMEEAVALRGLNEANGRH